MGLTTANPGAEKQASAGSSIPIAPVAGAAVGGACFLVVVVILGVVLWKYRKNKRRLPLWSRPKSPDGVTMEGTQEPSAPPTNNDISSSAAVRVSQPNVI